MTNREIDNLITETASGNKWALEELYRAMSKPVYYYALHLLGNPDTAEDVMQDTFVSIMRNAGTYKGSEKGKSWIFTIAKNKATDIMRKQKNNLHLDEADDIPISYDGIEKSDSNNTFLGMLKVLNEKERDIVTLRLLSDMTLTQVSEELNMPKGTVFWTYNNAIKKLRKANGGGNNEK